MIIENKHWSVDCDQCLKELDTDDLEVDGAIYDEEELIKAASDYKGWIYDKDHDVIFCCEECHQAWLEDNAEDESEAAK